jgi:hypothetical protein
MKPELSVDIKMDILCLIIVNKMLVYICPVLGHRMFADLPLSNLLYIRIIYFDDANLRIRHTLRLRYRAQPVTAVYFQNHTEHADTLSGQNAGF